MPSRMASSRRTPRSPASALDAPFRPWLLRIVANEARNRRRSADRRTGLALRAAAADPADDSAVAASPEAEVLASETRDLLHAALRELRDEDREVIGARYFLGLSEAETAEALALPAGTGEVTDLASARSVARGPGSDRRRADRWLTSRSSPSIDARMRPSRTASGCWPARSTGPRPPRPSASPTSPRRSPRDSARRVGAPPTPPGPSVRRGGDGHGRRPVAPSSWRSSP